jgi:hypothetical protein
VKPLEGVVGTRDVDVDLGNRPTWGRATNGVSIADELKFYYLHHRCCSGLPTAVQAAATVGADSAVAG